MKPISPKHYLQAASPYPAHIFAATHPLRVESNKVDVGSLIQQQRTAGNTAHVIKYQRSNSGE